MPHIKPSSLAVILFLGLLLPVSADGAGYYFSDAGTRALGRGTAFIASADDLSAQYYNPAALVRVRGNQMYYSLSAVDQYVYFDRNDEPEEDLTFDPIYNQSPAFLIPAFSFSSDFGLPDTTFALGFFSPFAPDLTYPADGAQRYVLIDSLIWQFAVGATVAHRITDWLAVGIGLESWFLRVEQQLALTMAESDDPSYDIDVGFKVWDKFKPVLSLGLLLDPSPAWSIGLSMRPPIRWQGKGSITADFEGHIFEDQLDGTTFIDDDITMLLNIPIILRGGVALRPVPDLELETAMVYEGWSSLEQVTITDLDLTVKANPDSALLTDDIVITNDVELLAGYRDTFSLRMGGEYDLDDRYSVRAGAFYETSAVPPENQGVGLVDTNKFGFGAGASVDLRRFRLDLSLARLQLASRDITDSALRQLWLKVDLSDPSGSEITDGKVVGNGHFTSHLDMASLAATVRLGHLPDTGPSPRE